MTEIEVITQSLHYTTEEEQHKTRGNFMETWIQIGLIKSKYWFWSDEEQAEKLKSREMKEGWMKNDEGWMKNNEG